MTIASLQSDFELLDDWEDRYRYIIELGRTLKPFPDALRTEATKVRGCTSQVWLASEAVAGSGGDGPVLRFQGDSDAHIVRGLVAIIFALYNGKTANEIPVAGGQARSDPPNRPACNIRSFVTSHADGAKTRAGSVELRGIASDGGSGIARVQVSPDGGTSWRDAALGENLGRYSFRPWSLAVPLAAGTHAVKVRAYTPDGTTQPLEPLWQPAGYMRNVVETVDPARRMTRAIAFALAASATLLGAAALPGRSSCRSAKRRRSCPIRKRKWS